MDGVRTRQEARERLDQVFFQLRDKYIPADANQPTVDGRFWQWESLADEFDRVMTAAIMEELAGQSKVATLREPGNCPHCGSSNTKWIEPCGQRERRSKHGNVVLPRQVGRCRSCDRSFSPSGAGVGIGR